ncbi:HlyD family type I secretion periplasmic adaptor subunit [Chelativorans salis]|uniref:Membrane fusion protein (MFP) family protein n=1 Tax=Chelativorans salis TaxID=2978478 RepID=A0ABT2LUL4_9HYPH|nr:HlyD family type I secretion periplasmic adaptor subunit [Chelativorans sp. EGI FJ00035]MCT7378218.1 HlyD family type I secretion periplasmic adaptor subunit [Chelativorans sp. EGI FJ00035]
MAWHDGVRTGLTGPVLAGLIALVGGFGGFAAWAVLAPMSGAVIAPAKITVEGHNKIVQHLEGGIVREILVEDGQKVDAGQPVLVLDGTAARSEANRLKAQLAAIEAVEARTLAERDGAAEPSFPAWLLTADDAETVRLLDDQRAEFDVRLRMHKAEIAVLEQQIAALEEQIAGHEVQEGETARQMAFLAEERQDLETLLAQGLTRKSQVLALKRAEAELKGRQGQLTAAVAESKQSIAEIRERIEQARSARISETSAQLAELRFKRTEILEKLRAAQDVSGRLVVRAPASGIVIDLAKHNTGAVITPGQELMTIVPEGTGLVVEARVRPQDIDELHMGQEAWLNFSAFDTRQTPPVAARVVYMSADRLENERTGEPYYLARLEISADPASGFDPSRVGPGHDVEVFITTGERTFFEYIAAPLTKTLARSFRES